MRDSQRPNVGTPVLFGMCFPETDGTGDPSLNPLFTHISFFKLWYQQQFGRLSLMHAHQHNLTDLAQELRPVWRKCPHPLTSPCAVSMILRDIFLAGFLWGASSTKVFYLQHLNLDGFTLTHIQECVLRVTIVDRDWNNTRKTPEGTIKKKRGWSFIFLFVFFCGRFRLRHGVGSWSPGERWLLWISSDPNRGQDCRAWPPFPLS